MPIFRVKSVKIYTGQKKFTLTPSVASVTIIRYDDTNTSAQHAWKETQLQRGDCQVLSAQHLYT